MNAGKLSVRVNPGNLNHHLWKNNGTWFVHYTRHEPGYRKVRCRHSLGTKSLDAARHRRDVILNSVRKEGRAL
jgi:hypothetical protein